MDVNTGESITLENVDLTIKATSITFTAQNLRENRRYDVTVIASNVHGQAISQVMISKGISLATYLLSLHL